MPESFVQISEGAGKKLRTFQRVVGANTVEEEVTLAGFSSLATYSVTGTGVSIATANDHPIQIMAGASLNVYIQRLRISQQALATTAAIAQFRILRLTTAGTGGSSLGFNPLDTADAAAGATGMALPTAKGTEGAQLWAETAMLIQTVPTGGAAQAPLLFDIDFDRLYGKPLRIPAGTANGICFKNVTAVAAASIQFTVTMAEANY
jgi:hypothetical protein